MKHFYEEYDESIQKLIELMNDDFPTNYELVITPVGAEIRSTLSATTFTRKSDQLTNELQKMTAEFLNELKEKSINLEEEMDE